MGASNKIQDTNLDITQFTCSCCFQPFTQQDKQTDNWEVWWDTSNDVSISEDDGDNDFVLGIWVRDITHKFQGCPETEKCHDCYSRFLTEKMKQFNDNYYCLPCYKEKAK